MRIPLEWLREFIELKLSPTEIAKTLTMAGLEVEGIEDSVLEVNVTPNRPDCLSILGIARELSAITGLPIKFPGYEVKEEIPAGFRVEIVKTDLCRRYAGRVIRGVRIAESPEWMKKRLQECGLRAVNNIVDITNYVQAELGHPLHAFDLETLKGGLLRVDAARKGDRIVTLDGVERGLPEDALLIMDAERPVAVAGVMGGAETEVSARTKDIFLESAWFLPASVRRTSKRMGLSTESSYRFERGADIEMPVIALNRAAYLISRLAGGRAETVCDSYPVKFQPVEVTLRHEKLRRVLGIELPQGKATEILNRLNFAVKEEQDLLRVSPPSYRPDIEMDYDLIEEIARLWGYGRILSEVPKAGIAPEDGPENGNERLKLLSQVKTLMRTSGFNEAINYSFMSADALELLGIPEGDRRRRALPLKNPLRKEESLLRTTLIPSLLDNFTRNFFRGLRDICMFELSRVFEAGTARSDNPENELPVERLRLAGIYYKERFYALYKERAEDFYMAKGAVEALFSEFKLTGYSFTPSGEPFLHEGQSADIHMGNRRIGFIGSLSPLVIERLDIKPKADVIVFELDMDGLLWTLPRKVSYEPAPRFPSIERDIAIVLDEVIKAGDVIALIRAYPSGLIEDVSVFDLYRGAGIGAGKKSLAFNIRYRAKDRTLKDEEVEAVHQGVIKHLIAKTDGEIRGAS